MFYIYRLKQDCVSTDVQWFNIASLELITDAKCSQAVDIINFTLFWEQQSALNDHWQIHPIENGMKSD